MTTVDSRGSGAGRQAGAPAVPAAPDSREPGWRAARRLLHGPFRTLVAGQCLGQAGDGLAQIAFAQYVVFEAGRGATPTRIASLLAVTLLPFSLIGPFAGVLIDRWSRRRVLVVMSFVRAALTLASVATVLAHSQVGAFAGVLLLLSTSRFILAAKGAALPRTVAHHELVTANAISSVAGMSSSFVGAIGGAAFVSRSAAAGFLLASGLYLAGGLLFARLPEVGGGDGGQLRRQLRQAAGDMRQGVRAITTIPDVWRPLTAVWLHRLLLGAGFVILVVVADSRFHLRIAGYGLALGVTGIAAFAGSVAAPVVAQRWRSIPLLPLTFLPPALAALIGALAPNLPVLVAALGITAFAFQLLKVLSDALIGGAAPDAVRGRIFSVYDVLYNVAFVLAGLLMIPLWQPNRVRLLFAGVAVAFLAGGLLCGWMLHVWPAARRSSKAGERGGLRRPLVYRRLRQTVFVLILLLVLEYFAVPALIGAGRDIDVLGRLQPGWLAVGVVLEGGALLCYSLLTRAVLPPSSIRLWRLFRITLATTAFGHVVPAGMAATAGAGYRLLTAAGVSGTAAGFTLATAALGSAVVLNILLWLALLVSIPLAGFHPVYVVTALLGLLALSGIGALAYLFTRGEQRSVRIVRAIGRRLPRVGADRLESVVHRLSDALANLAADRRLLRRAGFWAALNWLLDAASLWCFLAALGSYVEPFELFAAYGIANVLAVIPVTPGGLGVIDATAPALLISSGVPQAVAAFGVLGWRLVNFWLPIPTGALAYLSLRAPRHRGAMDPGVDAPSTPQKRVS